MGISQDVVFFFSGNNFLLFYFKFPSQVTPLVIPAQRVRTPLLVSYTHKSWETNLANTMAAVPEPPKFTIEVDR